MEARHATLLQSKNVTKTRQLQERRRVSKTCRLQRVGGGYNIVIGRSQLLDASFTSLQIIYFDSKGFNTLYFFSQRDRKCNFAALGAGVEDAAVVIAHVPLQSASMPQLLSLPANYNASLLCAESTCVPLVVKYIEACEEEIAAAAFVVLK